MTPEERENYKKQKKQAWKAKRQEEMKEKKKVCVLNAYYPPAIAVKGYSNSGRPSHFLVYAIS